MSRANPKTIKIDGKTCKAKADGKENEKLNVELRVCGKKEAKKMNCPKHKGTTHRKAVQ